MDDPFLALIKAGCAVVREPSGKNLGSLSRILKSKDVKDLVATHTAEHSGLPNPLDRKAVLAWCAGLFAKSDHTLPYGWSWAWLGRMLKTYAIEFEEGVPNYSPLVEGFQSYYLELQDRNPETLNLRYLSAVCARKRENLSQGALPRCPLCNKVGGRIENREGEFTCGTHVFGKAVGR